MSVAGLLDAMRSNRPLSERIVWQCLENHANGARFWSMTIREIMDEVHLGKNAVVSAIKALRRDGIIHTELKHRCKTIYHMLRSYLPNAPTRSSGIDWDAPTEFEKQTLEAEIGGDIGFGKQTSDPDLEFGKQTPGPVLGFEKQTLTPDFEFENQTPNPTVSKNPPAARAPAREGWADADASQGKVPGHWIWSKDLNRFVPPPEPVRRATRSSVFGSLAQMGSPGPNGAETINSFDVAATTRRACELARIDPTQAIHDQCAPIRLWLNAGIEACDIFEIIRKAAERPGYNPPFSLGWFKERIMRRQAVAS